MITKKLLNLAMAMAEFEGWNPGAGSNNGSAGDSVSYRNHNPGNLRVSPFELGQRDDFAYFLNDEAGFYAMVWDIWQKAHGNTSTNLTGESSIYELIKIYSGENNEKATKYAKFVEKRTELPMSMLLKDIVN